MRARTPLPRGARLSQSVCRSQSSGQPAPGTSESQLLDRPVSPPTLPPHVSLHHSPALARTAMAESSAATQSPSISSSSSGAEPSALGSGGSPGACPALGAKSCGSSCAGEARGELVPWGSASDRVSGRGRATHPGRGRLRPRGGRLRNRQRGRGAKGRAAVWK